MRYQRAESPALLNGYDAAHRFFASCFEQEDCRRERLWVAHLDDETRCIHLERYEGEVATAELPIRSIVRDAARFGSAGVVLAHNHPSGNPAPSKADCRATRELAQAGAVLDLAVVDHLIFGGSECRSLRRLGYL